MSARPVCMLAKLIYIVTKKEPQGFYSLEVL